MASGPQDAPASGDGAAERPSQSQRPGGKKRKVALFLGYLGAKYLGMQRQPVGKTVEQELEAAICRAGGISPDNAGSFTKVHWSRAARTDKGVSAMGQVVSLKMMVGLPDIIERINSELPDDIRVYGFVRTTDGFDSRLWCDRRRYEYILPAWALDPEACRGRSWELYFRNCAPQSGEGKGAAGGGTAAGNGAAAGPGEPCTGVANNNGTGQEGAPVQGPAAPSASTPGADADAVAPPGAATTSSNGAGLDGSQAGGSAAVGGVVDAEPRAGRHDQDGGSRDGGDGGDGGASEEAVAEEEEPEEALPEAPQEPRPMEKVAAESSYVFDEEQRQHLNAILRHYVGVHNFHNFTVKVAAESQQAKRNILRFEVDRVLDVGGLPWVRLVVVGQSFMMHQIRKMVGMAIAVKRGHATMEALQAALDPERDYNVPMAPALGLYLAECVYEGYNKRWGRQHAPLSQEPFQAAAEGLKAGVLYPHIAAQEAASSTFATWLRALNEPNYRFTTWEAAPKARTLKKWVKGGKRPAEDASASVVAAQETYGTCKTGSSEKAQQQKRFRQERDAEKAAQVEGPGADAGAAAPATQPQAEAGVVGTAAASAATAAAATQ